MFRHVSLSVSGLIFLIIIAVIYFSKRKYGTVEFKIYRIQLVWTIATIILEIASNILISYRSVYPTLTLVMCRSYIFFSMVWFILMMLHLRAYLKPELYKTVKDVFFSKISLFAMISSVVMFIVSCFFKLEYTSGDPYYFNVIGGTSMFVLYYVFSIVVVLTFKVYKSNLNRITFFKRLPMLLYFILFGIMKVFQLVYSDLSDLGFLMSVCLVTTYFTLENQDYMLVEELTEANKEADLANKYKSEFLSTMSHEIRTPMNTILGFSENIINNGIKNSEETLNDVRNISIASKSLLEIINNILLYSRMESGKEKIENIEYSINDLLNDLKSFSDYKTSTSNINFNINKDPELYSIYEGDKQKIYRVFFYLIDNSFNNSLVKNIDLNVYSKNINNNIVELVFEIIDDGKKLKESDIESINSQLYRNDSDVYEVGNKGIVFLLINKLLKIMDAKIDIKTTDKGNSFVFTVNQKCLFKKDSKGINEISDNKSLVDCSNYNVLIVDDNMMNIQVSKKMLSRFNFDIQYVQSGRECINLLKKNVDFDLILLDHMMPEMDGIETIRIIKGLKNIKKPVIIAMSANNTYELQELYKKEGFDGYISKPIDINEFNEFLKRFVNDNRR